MKKTLLLCIAVLGLSLTAITRPVDLKTAQSVATKFMGTNDLQLATTYQTERNIAAIYVFNTKNGYVIVAADDCEAPIIGYSREGRFDPNNVPVQMEDYLQDFVARIQYGIENHLVADETTTRQWELVKATGQLNGHNVSKTVAPLLTEKWHQGCLYNSLCPAGQGPCDHLEVGCVAVAMGMIMHYWKYPATGWGSNSYNNSGTQLSADFGNTTYDWDHMPDSLTDNSSDAEIEAVATLLYHCGVSVNTSYKPSGSTANYNDVIKALVRYFSYSKRLHYEKRTNYSDEEWLLMLKDCLDLRQPVFYVGHGNQGGHAFVCDGYDGNDLLHFNWGWGVANGYFSLGNLNPLGYPFNTSQTAIFDIYPHYEPCIVMATANPPTAGTIEGAGEYHIGEQCTLTVTPAPDMDFFYWKKDGQTISNDPTYTFAVEADTICLEAHFSCFPVGEIAANYAPEANNPNSTSVSLTWNRADTEWELLKQFEIGEEIGGIATDDEYIYVTYAEWNNPPFVFGKYTMEGELIERFNIDDFIGATCLAYDGTDYYCNSSLGVYEVLYRVDFDNKTITEYQTMRNWFGTLAYDPEYDGFWCGHNYQVFLYDRQGQLIKSSPSTHNDYINGTGYFIAEDGNPHLLVSLEYGVYDYDINNNFIFDHPLLDFDDANESLGVCTGKYHGEEALFVVVGYTVYIYKVRSKLAQIIGYRIYRADSEGNTVMLADGIGGATYLDEIWNDAHAGMYRFGISEVYANGIESEIVWSDFIEKTDYSIGEGNGEPMAPSVQKVIENNRIIIIKDGKRYTVTGQQLK